jgi:hypothetical protein
MVTRAIHRRIARLLAAALLGLAAGCGGGFSLTFGGAGFGIGLGVVVHPDDDPSFIGGGAVVRDVSGQNFAGWTTVVGDGVLALAGEAPVGLADLQTIHAGANTVLSANMQARQIQAHNITYLPIADTQAMRRKHVATYEFRLPYLPTDPATTLRGQTIEGGLFIWDGAATRLDHGAAFQWRVNPASPDYGKLYTWRADGVNRFWVEIGRIEPDTQWHRLRIEIDPTAGRAALSVDNIVDSLALAREAKPGFGNDVTARFQIEAINAEPVAGTPGRTHQAEFRNWRWQWVL